MQRMQVLYHLWSGVQDASRSATHACVFHIGMPPRIPILMVPFCTLEHSMLEYVLIRMFYNTYVWTFQDGFKTN